MLHVVVEAVVKHLLRLIPAHDRRHEVWNRCGKVWECVWFAYALVWATRVTGCTHLSCWMSLLLMLPSMLQISCACHGV